MILERFGPVMGKEKYAMPLERDLAGLMLSHYKRVQELLPDKEKGISEIRWVLDHVEVESGGEKCLVVAGLFPAIDEEGKEIPGVRATPSVICIPKNLMKDEDWDLFKRKDENGEDRAQKEELVSGIVKNKETLKLYNAHGWGGNPYVMTLPMIDMAIEYDGVSVLMGVMGSMKTTRVDMSPRELRDSNMYGWTEIKKQIMGLMYLVEEKEQFEKNEKCREIRRVLIGHSMQGRTTLRLLVEELNRLPNTYFVPITPVMRGAQKEGIRHVILGHDIPGKIMKAEMGVTSLLMATETREKLLCWALPVIKGVIQHYLHEGSPYGENLLLLSHLLEYLNNPWAVMNSTKLLDNADVAIGKNTRHLLANNVDKFMLVRAAKDKVLSPEQLQNLILDLATPMKIVNDELVIDVGGEPIRVRACYFMANHYLSLGHWNALIQEELEHDLKKNGVKLPNKKTGE